jgi:DNA-binding GntR family transcriptional regulator
MASAALVPIAKQHMFDQIYEHMLEQISSGGVSPGDRIKDSEWATRLGVSRTPVREAIRKLSQEGLLISLPMGGYQIRRLTGRELVDLYRCRAALEAAAVREVALAPAPELLLALQAVLRDTDSAIAARDLQRGFDLNSRFHAVIVDGCTNSFVKNMLASLQRMIRFYRGTALREAKASTEGIDVYLDRLKIKQNHHQAIYKAIAAGKEEQAARLMNDHVTATVEDLTDAQAQAPATTITARRA